jgi:hypothetical protein
MVSPTVPTGIHTLRSSFPVNAATKSRYAARRAEGRVIRQAVSRYRLGQKPLTDPNLRASRRGHRSPESGLVGGRNAVGRNRAFKNATAETYLWTPTDWPENRGRAGVSRLLTRLIAPSLLNYQGLTGDRSPRTAGTFAAACEVADPEASGSRPGQSPRRRCRMGRGHLRSGGE